VLSQLDRPLSGADFRTYSTALSNLQGNILKSHGRKAAVHVFLTFHKGTGEQAKHFFSGLAPKLTSAAEQREQKRRLKQGSSELFTALYLSAKGYEHLGYSQGKFSKVFWKGMRAAKLGDPSPEQWEPPYQRVLHAMVLFAHDERTEIERHVQQLLAKLGDIADVALEPGQTINEPKVVEHFGYRDGISQPVFYKRDVKGTTQNWDPRAGPNLVLTQDPYGLSADDCGTYFVFRKLEQNVRGFRQHTLELAARLQANGAGLELAGAMVIGRFPNGTPVALHEQPQRKFGNDFRYSRSDPNGNRCPFSAHIRKINPRGGSGTPLSQERMHRIARRGITYGDPTPPNGDLNTLPVTGVGLLFQCCQADLANQFEFLQRQWANNAKFPSPKSGKDSVIGQPANGAVRRLHFPDPWGKSSRAPFGFQSFISMKGGEYFFAPSIPFLRSLILPRSPRERN
jgi:Dyp-type peroxidase family